ncbi:hypothetical protein PSEUDO8O_170335 [Pseudomonas sp. 8O]|nr:hypothetical protein PSEUDO8O_170335 [Pseudomonas sp. 8O]
MYNSCLYYYRVGYAPMNIGDLKYEYHKERSTPDSG